MLAWGRGGGHLGLNERRNVGAFNIFLAKKKKKKKKKGGGRQLHVCA